MFHEYDVVGVSQLINADRNYSGSEGIKRPPRIGDIGTILHIPPGGTWYIVECLGSGGLTVWLADFEEGELESVTAAKQG